MPEQGPVPRPRRPREASGEAVARPRTRPEAAEPSNGHAAPQEAPQPAAGPSPLQRRYLEAIDELRAATRALVVAPYAADEWEHLASAERIRQLERAVFVEPLGLGYQAYAASGVVMTLSRLRESRGDLTAELNVTRWGGLHLLRERINLSSARARSGAARELGARPAGKDVDWRETLEQLCVQVLDAQRSGTSTEEVGANEPTPEPPSVLRPYLPRGATLIWASQGTGKSTLAAAVAVSLEAVAEVLPGWEFVEPRRVLVLDWEASAGEWNDRIRRIADGAGCEPPVIAYRRMRVPLADQVEEIATECDERGIGYLVVDSVEKAAGASEGGTYEDKAERLFLGLDRIGRDSLLIDHVTGDDMRSGVSKVHVKSIGSNLKGAWARATYDLKRDPDRSTDRRVEMLLHNVKINQRRPLAPYEFAIVYDGDENTGPIRFERSQLTSPELMASLSISDRMYRVLFEANRPMSVKELATELEVKENVVRSLLSRDKKNAEKGAKQRFSRTTGDLIGLAHQGLFDG